MEQLSGAALFASRRRKRQLATYAWLACNSREDEGPNLPLEIVHKIARYVHDETDNEKILRTYNRIDKSPMKLYDVSIDASREYKPAAAPYYVIQRCVYECAPTFKFGENGRLVETGEMAGLVVAHTVHIISEADFERLRANGVEMWQGAAWNMETGEAIPAECASGRFRVNPWCDA